jgi:hypothetical protein
MNTPGKSVRNHYRRQGARRLLAWIASHMDEGRDATIVHSGDNRFFLIQRDTKPIEINVDNDSITARRSIR